MGIVTLYLHTHIQQLLPFLGLPYRGGGVGADIPFIPPESVKYYISTEKFYYINIKKLFGNLNSMNNFSLNIGKYFIPYPIIEV